MKKGFLIKELNVIRSRIYKSLPIYEEENGIGPKGNRVRKPVVVHHPLSFGEYIDRLNKSIEGLIGWLANEDNSEDNLSIIYILSNIKVELCSIQRIAGEEYHGPLRQKIFKNINIISELIDSQTNNQ